MAEPLDWDALVREAKRRRKAEGLTQQAHAALAGVSRETMRAFDNGGRSLTLEKALAILGVVGLVAGTAGGAAAAPDRHREFLRQAWDHWAMRTYGLEPGDPARLPHGRVAYSFALDWTGEDPTHSGTLTTLLEVLTRLKHEPTVAGLPPFHMVGATGLTLSGEEATADYAAMLDLKDWRCDDATFLDFWCVSADGHFFLLRGYQEDGANSEEPGAFMDLGLPVWRLADVVEHALQVAGSFTDSRGVAFQVEWQGLRGRQLINWRRPTTLVPGLGRHQGRTDMVRATVQLPATADEATVDQAVLTLAKPFYAGFDMDEARELVVDELAMRRRRYPRLGKR